ncbi:MAG: HsdR family type I site-specific deoxyribonuclease [Synergistaceae bacterium]|nr:HsdR family type I site-specific deoxyribonuclease [Synergistaceae bacterium]
METERQLQNRVIHWLVDDLHYTFLGSRENINNKPVIDDLLNQYLTSKKYSHSLITRAINDLNTEAGNQSSSLYEVNKKVYDLLRYGRQGIKDKDGHDVTVKYIDWEHPDKNQFYLAEEVTVSMNATKRPDLVLYVNGIALGMIELKNSCVSVGEGIRQMIRNQSSECIKGFFSTVQILMAGNGSQGLRYGVIETPEKYYLEWREDERAEDSLSRKVRREQSKEKNILRDGIISLCHPERFLNLIHDFMIFDAGCKKIARHNQYFAVTAAQARILQGEGGIIWNTQGSGKSLIMVWLAKWIREHIDDSRVVIITDREELDSQIKEVFYHAGEENVRRAESCSDLRRILNNHTDFIICSVIHKYGHNAGSQADIELYTRQLLENLPKNYAAKGNIIAFIDECHRTQSGKLHHAMKKLMPHAKLIGFTGTPLLKSDKPTSLATFGAYIHTYKFNEAVNDGVVVDLRYEARDVNQYLTDEVKIDKFFDIKTRGLTEHKRNELKLRWATINKLYSSRERLERIAADIIFDMASKPRLANDRGNAMLVAGSIYEACRYWEIFHSKGFTQCAVVTSYEPSEKSVRTSSSDMNQSSEEEYRKKIYEQMLNGQSPHKFEEDTKKIFKKTPAKMKLLIVVDKLLTGFDAPHATYLYIDKSMRDHDLFQAICRVNRRDEDDKDYGYIIDYKDLFRNIESAVKDYTSGAFDSYDRKDVEGFLKGKYDEAEAEMRGSLKGLEDLLSQVREPHNDQNYIEYFCCDERQTERGNLYRLTASCLRSFSNCSDRLESHYGYTENQVDAIRQKIKEYSRIKYLVMLASGDYIDLKAYDADMRYILDTYIHADESKIISELSNMSLVELLADGKNLTPDEVWNELNCDESAKPEVIENNIAYEISRRMNTNEIYYDKLSEMLKALIRRRKDESIDYAKYLAEVTDLARKVLHPENDICRPDSVKGSAALCAIYDYLGGDEKLTLRINKAILASRERDFKEDERKIRQICRSIYLVLIESGRDSQKAKAETEEIFEIVKVQPEYDQ